MRCSRTEGLKGREREDRLCSRGGHTIWTNLGTWCTDPSTLQSQRPGHCCAWAVGTQRALVVGKPVLAMDLNC